MKTMKIYLLGFILIFIMAGCNSDDTQESGIIDESISNEAVNNEPEEVAQENTNEDMQTNSEEQEGSETENAISNEQDSGPSVGDSKEDDEETKAETTTYVGEILDLTPPEDVNEYTTGLVIIRQEEDYWRAVDRQGNVYRIFTSAELKPGMVIEETYVSLDENEERVVELTSGYKSYNDTLINEGNIDQISQKVAEKIFAQYKLGQSLDSVKHSEDIGGGIKRYAINVTLENGEKARFEFTLYGYEDTWLLPSLSSFSNSQSESNNNIESEDKADNDTMDDRTDDTTDNRREEIYSFEEISYYQEHELLPQSNLTEGTDIYEYMTNIYVQNGEDKPRLIHKGGRNSYYEVLTQFGQRIYLKESGWEPFSEEYSAGIGFLDLTDNTYKVLYNGPVIEGTMLEDTFYFFADDQLLELSLGTGKYDSVTTLPQSINSMNLEIVSVNNTTMRITIENQTVKTYEINLEESTIEEYEE